MDESNTKPIAFSYVRWSSDQQRDGDSLRRQTAAAEKWCIENGYTLSSSNFVDDGVSAFAGRNAGADGKLGAFLEAVRSGAIPKGSTLLIENLDRLSRDKIRRARNTLENILDLDIDVVTLSDGKVYTRTDLDDDPLVSVMILLTFTRAREESVMKSKRLTAAWDTNTNETLAGNRVRSSQTPAWINVIGDPKTSREFGVIDDKANLVRDVFERFANGERPVGIARDLAAQGVPALVRGQWRGQTVSQLVRSEAAYGTLEIGRKIKPEEKDGTIPLAKGLYRKSDRVIIDKVRGYFPRIVDEETERRVRFRLEQREAAGGAEVKTTSPVEPMRRQTKAALTGVLKVPGTDRNAKRKAYARTAAYIDPVLNTYIGAVSHIDGVLIDYWPEIRKANAVETTPETEGLEAALLDAQGTLEYLQSKPAVTPRLLLAAEAEVEELEAELKRITESAGLGAVDLPRDVSDLEPHELNALVRRVVARIDVHKGEEMRLSKTPRKRAKGIRVPHPVYDLSVTMRNGIQLNIGKGLSGLKPRRASDEVIH
ncbi:recombinase family protein [uncultured Ruegeria sp.]|uniref:recombinase family protein n=1 Tax=uncultured Ruegeria sp. TaxID=259304 RepID=UPI00260D8FF9|nr:recombinase family protein [uncultured Ruegeria sp.]